MENLQLHNPDNPCHQKSVSDRKFVIFDLDGTLIDSFECVLRCVNKTLDSFSLPHIDIPLNERHGDIALIFDKAQKITTGKINFSDFKNRFDEIHLDDCIMDIAIIDVTKELLKNYIRTGVMIVVLTNKLHLIATKILKRFFPYAKCKVIGRVDYRPIKNEYSIINDCMYKQNLDIRNCILYYGDSYEDEMLALNMGVEFFKISRCYAK